MLTFWKMNGAGNDFVVLDNRDRSIKLDATRIARLCDRHRGVGADGLLMVEPASGADGDADYRMRYFNSDGGEAEMCGNGARCFAAFVRKLEGDVTRASLRFETQAGVVSARFPACEEVEITLSEPESLQMGRELEVEGASLTVHSVNTGVPHVVVEVEDLEPTNVQQLGAALRRHEAFAPAGANVNFMQVDRPGHIAIRTYERGVEAETLACGTGMVACAIVHNQLTESPPPVSVHVRGGDTLRVAFNRHGDAYSNVTLTGPADFVFQGTIA